jgi:hypothetical protein
MSTSPNKTNKVEFETNTSAKLDHLPKCSFCSRRDDSVYVVSIENFKYYYSIHFLIYIIYARFVHLDV